MRSKAKLIKKPMFSYKGKKMITGISINEAGIAQGEAQTNSPPGTAKTELVKIEIQRKVIYQEIKTIYANGEVSNQTLHYPNSVQNHWIDTAPTR